MVTRRGLKKGNKEQVEQLVSGMANISMSNEEEAGKMLALSAVYSREEDREKVEAHLRRVEEDAKQLAEICQEFEALKDPVRKEVIESVGDKDDWVNNEYKSLAWSCIKKEKKYREALEALDIFCKLNQAQYQSTKEKAAPETTVSEKVSEAVVSDGHSETKSETEQGKSDLISTDKEVDIKKENEDSGLRKTRRTIQKPERFEHSANHIKKGKGKSKKKL